MSPGIGFKYFYFPLFVIPEVTQLLQVQSPRVKLAVSDNGCLAASRPLHLTRFKKSQSELPGRPDGPGAFPEGLIGLPGRAEVVVLHRNVRSDDRGAYVLQALLHDSRTILPRGRGCAPGGGPRLPPDGGALSLRGPGPEERFHQQQEHQGNAHVSKVKPPFHL